MSWQKVKLKDVSLLIDYGLTASADVECDGPLFLRITDLGDGGVNWSKVPRCVCDEKRKQKNLLERGDIVFARTGATTGKSYLISDVSEDTVFASYLIRVRTTQKIYSPFLAYFFKSPNYWHQIGGMSSGATLPGVNASKLSELEIPLPPLDEQKRIAAILDKADAIRQKRKQAIELADEFLRSVFLDMFGDPVSNPKGWEVKTAGQCIVDGLILEVQDGNHGNDHPKVSDFVETGIPFVAANVIRKGRVIFDKCYYLDSDWLNKLRIGFAKPRDVVLTHKGTLGLCAVLDDTFDDYIFSPQTTYYRLNECKLVPEYLEGYFSSKAFQRLLQKEGKQSTRAYIGITRQKELPIIVPPVEKQREFLRVKKAFKTMDSKESKSQKDLDSFFCSLSQKAFSGQL
ncbi:restriction endonuclease subunit S [Aliivibrio fischeri]|uniref:restriction endonuclease subunit S n=1 Tax=Aliivibrio fischeri TaxID=668 RepID=UPI0012DA9789|nr:restriction endonuclease subunit S [Aliivibrio fischeri]MUL15825.1 hypothetical protein [Aliivibrio fischeri]